MGFKRRSLPEPTVNMSIIQSFAHFKTISCRVPNFDGSKEICNVPPEFALRFMGWVFAIQKLFSHGGPSPFIYLPVYPRLTGQDGRRRFRRRNRGHKGLWGRKSPSHLSKANNGRRTYLKKTNKVCPELLQFES